MFKGKFLVVCFLIGISSFVFTPLVFSQTFSRVIELRNPRMNGQDISSLQNRLLSLGFSIGSADGYYGPLAEEAVKNIQAFSGFESDGKVNRALWDYIFNSRNNELLSNINIVSGYNENQLRMSETDYMGRSTEGGSYRIYYSNDRRIRILKTGLYFEMGQVHYTCYFVSYSRYFILEKSTRYGAPMGGEPWSTENLVYYMNGNRMNQIREGVISQSDFNPSFLDEILNENLSF
jgi:peptidoglycan hydrolase-like protein with peptidoglycan-binding domain